METIERYVNRWLLPLAIKLNTIKGFASVRDAFLQILPFTLVGSFAVVINNVFLSPTGFVGQFLVTLFPRIAASQALLESVLVGTVTIMSLQIAFLVGRNMTKAYGCDDIKGGITSLVVFFMFYPPISSTDEGSFFTTTYFGAQGLFVAILIGIVVGWAFSRLSQVEKLQIKMPEMVPPEVFNSFYVVIPVGIILVVASILNYGLSLVVAEGLNGLIYQFLQAPFNALGASPFTLLILDFVAQLLWAFGIHGAAAISPITRVLYAEPNILNLEYVLSKGTAFGSPFPYTWLSVWEHYGTIGGSGNTLGLLLAILFVSYRYKGWKRKDYTDIAKLSLFPGLFGINEPLIFGLPIVLNPLLMVPFILAPLVNMTIGIISISLNLIPPGVLDAGWTTPQPLKEFFASGGAWQSLVSQVVAIIVATLIYLPFVLASNKAAEQSTKEGTA